MSEARLIEASELNAARAAFVIEQEQRGNPIMKMIPPGYRLSDEAMDRIKLLQQATTRNQRRVLRKMFDKRDARKRFVTFVKK